MTDLISSNDEQQEMAKQVEAIAEAAAQRDSQIAQMLNLVPKAAALSTAASRAISFTKKTWVDDPTSGTPITAADMNRLEQAIVDLNTTLTSVQNSLSQVDFTNVAARIDARRCGMVVEIDIAISTDVTMGAVYATVPAGYRPITRTFFPCYTQSKVVPTEIRETGEIVFFGTYVDGGHVSYLRA